MGGRAWGWEAEHCEAGAFPGCVRWREMLLEQGVGAAWPWVLAVVPDHRVALDKSLSVFELQFCYL